MNRKELHMRRKGLWIRILGLLTLLALLSACGGTGAPDVTDTTETSPAPSPVTEASPAASPANTTEASPATSGATIQVGSKNFTESLILGEMYAQLLEANGFQVERKLNLGATPIAHQALLNDEIDLYPEYTSTGLLTVLQLPPLKDREEIFNTVKKEYEEQFDLTWLQPTEFNNTQALAMTKERAEELGITTYSDLSKKADQLVLGGPPEFIEREDGLPGLQEAYGGFQFKEFKQLDPGLRYQALLDDQIDVVVAFGTDGQIGGYDLQLLEDDKNFYPPYQAAPVIRMDTLEANPNIADILNQLAPLLDDKTMADLNWQVDGENREPADVARQFLTEQGLIE
jgi:osmoprotectant transport system substrate-binding protein